MNLFSCRRKYGDTEATSEELRFQRLWRRFNRRFRTEESCWSEMKRLIKANELFRCEVCHCTEFGEGKGRRIFCSNCHFKTSVTAGNLFERIRFAKPWLAAIWFMERGFAVSSYRLHRLVGVAQSTALNILRKVRIVLESLMVKPDKVFPHSEFHPIMTKRSRATPANMHPMTEDQSLGENEHGGSDGESLDVHGKLSSCDHEHAANQSPGAGAQPVQAHGADVVSQLWQEKIENLTGTEKLVFEALSDVIPLSIDEICARTGLAAGKVAAAITMLELDDFVESPFANNFVRSVPGGKLGRPPSRATRHGALGSTGPSRLQNEPRTAFFDADFFIVAPWNTENVYERNSGKSHGGSGEKTADESREKSGEKESWEENADNDIRRSNQKSPEEEFEETDLQIRISTFLFQNFDGVSRKYIQLYLAAYWCYKDRTRWFSEQLFCACFRSLPVSYAEILLYSSPRNLKVIESQRTLCLGFGS